MNVAPPPLERAHLLRYDLDWVPRPFRAVRWAVAGGVWTSIAAGMLAAALLTDVHFYFFGYWLSLFGAGGFYAGDRAARAILRRRLRRLARGAVDLGRLSSEHDGELVHVRGRVRARRTVTGLIEQEPAVYRRLVYASAGHEHLVSETAFDFLLEPPVGAAALVEVERSRLIVDTPPLAEYRLGTRGFRALRELVLADSHGRIRAAECLVRDGDDVEVVGYKTRVIDPSISARLDRDAPLRTTLRGGSHLPLLIAPAVA